MIIYGWGHFNRRDHSLVRAGCGSCGRRGYQRSYTSSKFFTLYFIPLIPLGRQKILSECPHCKQAVGMSASKWKRLRATEVPRVVLEYEANPTNEEAAKAAIGTIATLQDRAALQRIGPQIQRAFSRNGTLLGLIAGAYSHLCMDAEADAVYLEAVRASDDPDIAAEADSHLKAQKETPPRPPNRLLQSLPVLIVPAALLFGFATFAQKAATSRLEHTYVVSGLERPYRVIINGEEVALRPFQRVSGRMLVHGENSIAPATGSEFIAARSFTLDMPWWRRLSSGPVVVVNPDEAAVLVWERTRYANGRVPDDAYQFEVATGRTVHAYDDIDYPFQVFPPTIQTSANSGLQYRYRVSDLGRHDLAQAARLFGEAQQAAQLQAYVRARLRAEDGGTGVIHYAAAVLPADEFRREAESRLQVRPVLVEWHRAFQEVVERTSDDPLPLIARYQAMVEREPENSALHYLLSRLLLDPDEATATLTRATQFPQPCAYAFNGLAYRHFLDGDFQAALARTDEALLLEPGNESFKNLRRQALYGLRAYDTLEREAGNLLSPATSDATLFYDHVYRLAKLGRGAQARSEISRYVGLLHQQSPMSDVDRRRLTAYLESAIDLALADRPAFGATIGAMNDPYWAFQRAVIVGDLDAALALESSPGSPASLADRLALYALCHRAGKTAAADQLLDKAAAALAEHGAEGRRCSAWLRTDEPPDPRLAAQVCVDLDLHPVYLVALAQRHPNSATDYLGRAAALKARDTFHTLALADWLPH